MFWSLSRLGSPKRSKQQPKLPEQTEFIFKKPVPVKKPKKKIRHNVCIQGIPQERIDEVISRRRMHPLLFKNLPTRAHVEQRIRILNKELETTGAMLKSSRTHHIDRKELQDDVISLSEEIRIMQKLLQ